MTTQALPTPSKKFLAQPAEVRATKQAIVRAELAEDWRTVKSMLDLLRVIDLSSSEYDHISKTVK